MWPINFMLSRFLTGARSHSGCNHSHCIPCSLNQSTYTLRHAKHAPSPSCRSVDSLEARWRECHTIEELCTSLELEHWLLCRQWIFPQSSGPGSLWRAAPTRNHPISKMIPASETNIEESLRKNFTATWAARFASAHSPCRVQLARHAEPP